MSAFGFCEMQVSLVMSLMAMNKDLEAYNVIEFMMVDFCDSDFDFKTFTEKFNSQKPQNWLALSKRPVWDVLFPYDNEMASNVEYGEYPWECFFYAAMMIIQFKFVNLHHIDLYDDEEYEEENEEYSHKNVLDKLVWHVQNIYEGLFGKLIEYYKGEYQNKYEKEMEIHYFDLEKQFGKLIEGVQESQDVIARRTFKLFLMCPLSEDSDLLNLLIEKVEDKNENEDDENDDENYETVDEDDENDDDDYETDDDMTDAHDPFKKLAEKYIKERKESDKDDKKEMPKIDFSTPETRRAARNEKFIVAKKLHLAFKYTANPDLTFTGMITEWIIQGPPEGKESYGFMEAHEETENLGKIYISMKNFSNISAFKINIGQTVQAKLAKSMKRKIIEDGEVTDDTDDNEPEHDFNDIDDISEYFFMAMDIKPCVITTTFSKRGTASKQVTLL